MAHVLAVSRDATSRDSVMSHTSAAVLWGLPLFRLAPRRVHMTTANPIRISSAPDVMRHCAVLAEAEVTSRNGIQCTTLERTVFDLARTVSPEAAVSVADAGLRLVAVSGQYQDEAAAARWRGTLREMASAERGSRGIRQARHVIEFADGRAQLPGESVSRLHLARLGFATPRLQVAVADGRGGSYWMDFALDDVHSFGEFDGKGKYLDESLRSGRSIEEVMLAEKVREDWIRGTTQRRFARWGDEHIGSFGALGRRLAAFAIHPSGRA
ncbi:hypothetical protein ACPW96_15415 [Micromonospora sp. DT81.3]|uniref:hypothetical protein n=1 Tax=Micromonospora sp. DT81.3 TaxID=3416523 RepID=UPI003CE9180C